MASIKLYLDIRGIGTGTAPIKVSVNKNSSSSYINTGIRVLPSQWDKRAEKIKDHPNKVQLNSFISHKKNEVQNTMMRLAIEGELKGMSASQIKNRVMKELEPDEKANDFVRYYKAFALSRKSESTKRIYLATLDRLRKYDPNVGSLNLDDISKKWLDGLEAHFLGLGQSMTTVAIDLRNIRACINDAIDNELLSSYVFRKKKIKAPKTRKRSLSVERLRELWNYPVERWQQRYLDIFKLTFYLIGINLADLVDLVSIEEGRISYNRHKTGRPYYIKVEPEAMELIEKYRGTNFLLNIKETYKSYKSFMTKCNRGLQSIGTVENMPNPKYKKGSRKHKTHIRRLSAFEGISLYWARHSWATLAAELEIPKETIAAALGHSSSQVTDVYIKFNYKKVDEANREVIDYLLGKS